MQGRKLSLRRDSFRNVEAKPCGREGVGWGPQLLMSVDEMLGFWGSGTLLLHCSVCVNEPPSILTGLTWWVRFFIMSLWPQGCGRKLKAFQKT